ncbi:Flp pilus assembly protein CpaB [Aliihoeflea aestuarii]|jgi:pilus assembly protein CpaB|uniref:Flp pilus assembly protein CpaB n=1 Tax=Aliihoeflea aestuarii TaxID=453840 RepID=UPI002093DEE2|nr:Flp pilus assembly protein CpaB [Aliihoeflea aestuarii]MCO6391468.1 Flp pilus assembly protein CpaB [Aliihoeflea aestuarii]
MAPSRVIILGVAVMAAAGAGLVARNIASQPPEQIVLEAAAPEPAIRLTEVLVMNGDVPMGAELGGQLSWQSWPSSNVYDYFIQRDAEPNAIEDLSRSIARVPIYAGEPLRRSKLIGEGQSFMSSILPSGKRAIATRISADTSAGGFILPNDYVDVIMTRRQADSTGAEGYATETILQNIRVLAIDQAIQEDEEGRRVKVGETATLELTPEQSEIITVAQQMADRLSLALRSVVDTQEEVNEQADHLLSGNGRRGSVRLIKSGQVTEVGARQ